MEQNTWKSEFPQAAKSLETARRNRRVGQAYLLIGDDAAALRRFALGWAQTAACTSPNEDGSACGNCANCRNFAAGDYCELYLLEPESKLRTIKVDAMKEYFLHQLYLTVPKGFLKIGLIIDADCISKEAENAFLKTLEEPPEQTLLLLTTTRPAGLLPTTRSRCQNVLLYKNRIDYSQLLPESFLELLPTIRRGAGSRAGFNASRAIAQRFEQLKGEAEMLVDESWDENWEELSKNDRAIRKRLEEMRVNRVAAEYLRSRQTTIEAIHAWFQQRYLVALGIAADKLPQPEFAARMADIIAHRPPVEEAEEDLKTVQTCIQALRTPMVPEEVALDTFCLQVCRKV